MTRHDVDGHLWKGRIGVKHTLRDLRSNLLFSEGKKESDSETTGGRSSRRDYG